ncbi:MAG: 2-C-methyl-D-erythritol 2,4-cyclodiphosphate synthase [Proteobacteria bacterium]|nr:2-C-methyl-D-erythritol 2,4-cyclodiphosphate synthase [Pseudomonadota bacterium]
MKIGSGFDVHAFGEGDFITLGGVKISHDRGFVAHSDGDVLIHAICDALLGACALGDIGTHFPPSDPQWENCASAVFLKHCHRLIQKENHKIGNIDCTIIAELPKMQPHISAIQQSLSQILGIKPQQISVKATTTEKLGFTGREQGIAVQAVCLLIPAG